MTFYTKFNGSVLLLFSIVIATLCQAQYQDTMAFGIKLPADFEEPGMKTPTELQTNQSTSVLSIKSSRTTKGLKILPTPSDKGVHHGLPNSAVFMDPNINRSFLDPQTKEALPFLSEDEIMSVPEEPSPEGKVSNHENVLPGTNYYGKVNFVHPPATLQFTIPSFGQIVQIPGTLNLSWSPIGLVVAPRVFNIEARHLSDNSITPIVSNLSSNQRVYLWNIPQGTKEGMYRLFVYTETGRGAPTLSGHLNSYEGEVFELLYAIPQSSERSSKLLLTSSAPTFYGTALVLATCLSLGVYL